MTARAIYKLVGATVIALPVIFVAGFYIWFSACYKALPVGSWVDDACSATVWPWALVLTATAVGVVLAGRRLLRNERDGWAWFLPAVAGVAGWLFFAVMISIGEAAAGPVQ